MIFTRRPSDKYFFPKRADFTPEEIVILSPDQRAQILQDSDWTPSIAPKISLEKSEKESFSDDDQEELWDEAEEVEPEEEIEEKEVAHDAETEFPAEESSPPRVSPKKAEETVEAVATPFRVSPPRAPEKKTFDFALPPTPPTTPHFSGKKPDSPPTTESQKTPNSFPFSFGREPTFVSTPMSLFNPPSQKQHVDPPKGFGETLPTSPRLRKSVEGKDEQPQPKGTPLRRSLEEKIATEKAMKELNHKKFLENLTEVVRAVNFKCFLRNVIHAWLAYAQELARIEVTL